MGFNWLQTVAVAGGSAGIGAAAAFMSWSDGGLQPQFFVILIAIGVAAALLDPPRFWLSPFAAAALGAWLALPSLAGGNWEPGQWMTDGLLLLLVTVVVILPLAAATFALWSWVMRTVDPSSTRSSGSVR